MSTRILFRASLALAACVACSSRHGQASADAGPDDAATGATDAATGATDAATGATDAAAGATDAATDAAHADPCTGVTCDSPPPPTCTDASTLVTYAATGTCSAGTCAYAPTAQTCSNGCLDGACVGSATDACGVCDRAWQCDAALDQWSSIVDSSGLGCEDDRTGTTLRCNGEIDNPSQDSYGQGTWHTTSFGMALVFGGINGFSPTEVDCYPSP